MTDEIVKAGNPLEQYDETRGGLVDLDLNVGTPRIKILGREALFEDTLSGLTTPQFSGVITGTLKQRVLWPPELGETPSQPLCKSLDFKVGRPDIDNFPLKESKIENVSPDALVAGVELSCAGCNLKEWDSHPQRVGPWCTEQLILVLLADFDGKGNFAPALLTLQRSSLTPARKYLGSFERRQERLFSVFTNFSLEAKQRGNVKYAVPNFRQGDSTDETLWVSYAQTYLQARQFLLTWREDEETGDPNAVPQVAIEEELPEF